MPETNMKIPIPEPLRGNEIGTFTHSSVAERLPEIAERTIAENRFPPGVEAKVKLLIDEIPGGKIRLLDDPGAPDSEDWHSYVTGYLDQNWLEVPWFFAEFYFYRRILEATGFFSPNDNGYQRDPFNLQKQRGFEAAKDLIRDLAALVGERIQSREKVDETIAQLLKVSLWGNQADLSMWPVGEGGEGEKRDPNSIVDRILIDDTDRIVASMLGTSPSMDRADIILDNAGFELITDLLLADYVLSSGLSSVLYLHPKSYPIFVSDVIHDDLVWTLDALSENPSVDVRASVDRLRDHQRQGRLRVHEHTFWTSPLALWEMTQDLCDELSKSDLVVFKGDMNYRRLLGDRHWGYEVPFEEVLSYFTAPITAVRTLKAEIVCGLKEGQAETTALKDPEWMVNGQWGVIQFRGEGG
jgi:uncharacterized protein with ATP-grasp and redox domains